MAGGGWWAVGALEVDPEGVTRVEGVVAMCCEEEGRRKVGER